MTADDVTYCRRRSEDSEHQTDVHFYLRILATYHALAASQQNVEWWKGHHARLMDEAQSQLDALRTQLAAAREDSARLEQENALWRAGGVYQLPAQTTLTASGSGLDTARSTDAERTGGNHARVP